MTPLLAISGLARSLAFPCDVAVTAAAAWLAVCACGLGGRSVLEASLAWLLSLSALVAGSAVVLGETGGLGAAGFLGVHAAVLAALALARRRRLGDDRQDLARAARAFRGLLNEGGFASLALVVLLLALAAMSVLAALAEPATADALSYHLPRIGQWLLDGRVTLLATQDPRMNFVAGVPDLVMAWVIGGSATGFRPADLVEAAGGVMAFGATVGLARQTGLGRGASVLAGALLLGMANVVVQFTASQTDLFTTGVFASSFYLWLCALRRGEGSVLGGMGAGFALGAKGTLFYLAPGAAVWVAFLAWRNPRPLSKWLGTAVAAALGILLFAAPGFVRNERAYGDMLGPRDYVAQLHKGARSPADLLRKLQWNLTCTLAQAFEPQSQPLGLRSLGARVVGSLEMRVPEKDPYTLYGIGRRERLQNAFLHRTEPDADFTSFGMVTLVLFAAGALASLALWRRGDARMVAAWSAGVLLFVVFFDAMQQWHPYAYRYFVLAAPWIAVVSAWGLERVPGAWRAAAWALVLAAAANVAWRVNLHTYQSGWRAVVEPGKSLTYFASEKWGRWSAGLDPGDAPLGIYLPEGRAVAGFYRTGSGRPIYYKPLAASLPPTAEEFTRGDPGWVAVPPDLYLGREGRVQASVWLYNGDTRSPFSVAAYRQLQPGEQPRPVLYGDRRTDGPQAQVHDLLVKAWDAGPVPITLVNPGPDPVGFQLLSPLSRSGGRIPAGSRITVRVALPPGSVSQVRISFAVSSAQVGGAADPYVEP